MLCMQLVYVRMYVSAANVPIACSHVVHALLILGCGSVGGTPPSRPLFTPPVAVVLCIDVSHFSFVSPMECILVHDIPCHCHSVTVH